MREDTLALRGAPARPLPRPSLRWSAGRVCAEEGCETRLSIYNKSSLCWQHEPVRYHLVRGKRRRRNEDVAA